MNRKNRPFLLVNRQNRPFLLKTRLLSPLGGSGELQAVEEAPRPEAGPGPDLEDLVMMSVLLRDMKGGGEPRGVGNPRFGT